MLLLQKKQRTTLQGDRNISVNMPDNFMLSIVSVRGNYKELHLVQGGAPPYFALPVRAWRNNHFTGRWIGRGGRRG